MRPRPNILWILTTQWRAQACGYAGDPNARTPVLDELASQSVDYAQAVTPHPFGPFARAALLTGVPSPANGVRDYFDALPMDARTIAHDLRDLGYATAWIGKWHLWKRDPAAPLVGEAHAKIVVPPEARGGFEFWAGFESGFLLNHPWLHGTPWPEPVQHEGYQPDVLADVAERYWLAGGEERRPWFCVVSMENPHPPYAAPPADRESLDPRSLVLNANVPRGGAVEERARRELAGYYAHIAATDRAIGRLLRLLATGTPSRSQETGEAPQGVHSRDGTFSGTRREVQRDRPDPADTIVVFTSVHGDMHGAHGLFRKGWPHEESLRVPLLVRRPHETPRRSDEPVSLLDLRAMTLAWAEGRAWQCPRDCAEISMPSVVPFRDQCDRVWRGVRTTTSKVVLHDDGAPWLVFDRSADPYETNNLAGSARGAELAAFARMRLRR